MTATASEGTSVPTPVRERGYTVAQSVGFWSIPDLSEHTPELRWPSCLDIYQAMPRQDAQVSSVLQAVRSPIIRTPWRIDGTGCDPKVTAHISADLGLPIVGEGNEVSAIRTRDRFSWQQHLREALRCLQYGHAIFEQVYRPIVSPREGGDGLAHLRKLGYRPPKTIAKFNVARDGGLTSIEQFSPDGTWSSTVTLPVSRLLVYVHDQENGNWTGIPLLRAAYKNWLLKDRLLRVQTQSIERNGIGIPKYTGAEGEQDLSAGEQIAAETRAGDNSGIAIPNGADLELMGVSGTLPDADKVIRYHDEQIARAVLAHFLNLGSQTGSWALGSTFADFFTLSLQSVAEEIRDTATKHIIEDIVDINYGPNEPAPRLVFDEIGSRNDGIVQAIASLVAAKVLQPDEDLEQFLRTTLGLPPRGGQPVIPQEAP